MDAKTLDRFMAKVCVGYGGSCWVWTGARTNGKYGLFTERDGVHHRAHRFSFFVCGGSIPDGMEIDHLCKNKLCVNPDHLEPVTGEENRRRAGLVKRTCAHAGARRYRNQASRTWVCMDCERERGRRRLRYMSEYDRLVRRPREAARRAQANAPTIGEQG